MARSHEELKTLIAPYAIGALPEDEMPIIRDHILSCEECMREADLFAETGAALSQTITPVPVPAGFADAILAKVRPEPEPETARSRGRASWFPRFAFAGLGIVVAVLAALLLDARGDLESRRREVAQLRETSERNEQIVATLVHGDRAWDMDGSSGAAGRMVPGDQRATLAVAGLQPAPQGHTYQLWLLRSSCLRKPPGPCEPVSAGTFDAESGVVVVNVERSLEGYAGAAVTLEPAGGSDAPTTDPLLATT